MFLYEEDLKTAFWDKYGARKNVKNFAFEIGRAGSIDLVTFEYFSDKFEFNAFEFKLENIKKAVLQASYNLKYVHKSWIVMPEEKKNVIMNKYSSEIKRMRGLGVMLVSPNGTYEIIIKPRAIDTEDLRLNSELLRLAAFSDLVERN